ncbi:uncharacterized protein BYT42DRAFT_559482 [Radiomyces spectabilis]|uniref:uncharacterized protein n=1 Tax=Radiomyces spectabilis TaxID=64574 RepID=UPI00221FB64F|nr:uncharacterized protein BYT42DRAFT_559482 [Radiomyces spectabilis]KAI8388255.1 hypothetical protein BYT42DRAFT_559482 [Radiomyces spectabilis]
MSTTTDIHAVIHALQQQAEETQNDNLLLRSQLEENMEQQRELGKDNDYLRQKIAAIQQDNANYSKTQARLETQLYAQEQDMAALRKEIQQLTKSKKDTEKKLSHELETFENDRVRWQQREADLYNQLRSLSSGEPRTPRTPRRRSVTATTLGSTTMSPFTSSPLGDIGENESGKDEAVSVILNNPTPKLAPIDSSFAKEAKIAQRTIRAQDKLILDLKNEIEKQKNAMHEHVTEAQRQSLRLEHLEMEIANVKQVNRSLMEDNESYQILLHEKTISGEFMTNPIMQVEEDESKQGVMKPSNSSGTSGMNLAAELASVGAPTWDQEQKFSEAANVINKLNEEIKTLQDTNRALQLYMNKILMKIINNKQLEDVLSIDQPKPKPVQPVTTSPEDNSPRKQAAPGPTPTRTLSSTLMGRSTNGRTQRRRTISYWGAKPSPVSIPSKVAPTANDGSSTADDRNIRRHSSIAGTKEPERTPATNGGWAKALRRMSVIGWSAKTDESSTESEDTEKSSSESVRSKEAGLVAPSSSRSGSSTPSLRRSNELATLQEE